MNNSLLILLSFFLLGLNTSFSQNTFQGTTNTDWFEDTNWSTGVAPGCNGNHSFDLIIDADCVSDFGGSCGQMDFYDDFIINLDKSLSIANTGQWVVRGANGKLTNNGTLIVDQVFQLQTQLTNVNVNAGTISVNSGQRFVLNGGEGTAVLQNDGTITVNGRLETSTDSNTDNNANIETAGAGWLNINSASTLTNSSSIILGGSGNTLLSNFTNETGGNLSIQSGSNAQIAATSSNDAGGIIVADGDLSVDTEFTNSGEISGTGTIISTGANLGGSVSPGGSPGNSVGILNTTNAIEFSGMLNIEITGRSDLACGVTPGVAGTDFDQIASTNNADITVNDVAFDFSGATGITNGDEYTILNTSGTVTVTGSVTANGGYTVVHSGNGIFQVTAGGINGPEIFKGPGTDFFTNANWCDGSSPLGCGGNSGIEIIIDADCETASCGGQTDFHHKLTINSGVTFTSNLTAGQHIMKAPNGELTNNGTMEIDQIFQVAGGGTHYNNGTINVNASTFWVNSGGGPVTMQNTGTININSGGFFRDVVSNGSTLDNDNMIIINSGGLVDFDGTNAVLDNSGIITVNGTLNINSGCVNTGTINGSGTLFSSISSSADLAGTVQPGNSVGILNTTNAITFSGTVEVEITGRGDDVCSGTTGTAGTDFDQISSTNNGDIIITDDLTFDFSGASGLTNGDTYTLISTGGTVSYSGASPIVSGGYTMTHVSGGLFQLTAGGINGPGPEIFEGPGTDFFTNANWCDGSSPLGCGGNSGIEIIIDADCETASCGGQTDFHHKLTINSGVTFTSNLTAGQHIMKGPNGELTNNGTMEIDRTFQVAAGSTHYNNGTINVNASTFWVNSGEGPVTMQNTGTININSGGSFRDVVSDGCTLDNDNMIIINSGGLVDFDGTNAVLDNSGIITVNGTLNINSGCVNTGTINGSGTLFSSISSSADLAGTIQPGNSVGILNTTNDITFSGEIDMEITGTGDNNGGVAGTDFDQISSTNAATITLENATVDLIFTGTNFYNGDTYTLFDAGTVTIVGTLSITNNNGYIIQHQGNGVFLIFSGALPVELIDFTARENDQTVILQWRTASELNNHGFHLQRSLDGKNWDDLAFIPGHGTTHEEQSYTYTDERPLPGLNYYRLRQEDFDGQFEYSQIVSIKMRNGGSGIRLFPNPATHSVTLALETDYDGEATLTLHDITGKQVRTQVLPLEGGTFRSSIELAGLPAGLYLAEVQAGREQWQERLVVE